MGRYAERLLRVLTEQSADRLCGFLGGCMWVISARSVCELLAPQRLSFKILGLRVIKARVRSGGGSANKMEGMGERFFRVSF